jgi:hypothetical protein
MLPGMPERPELLVELDGPGVSPETVDTLALLRLAETYFRLIGKVAEASSMSLSFRGLRVVDKCVAVSATPNNQGLAQLVSTRTLRIVSGEEGPPRGTEVLTSSLRSCLRSLPTGHVARTRWGKRSHPLVAPPLPTEEHPWETIELRVIPVRVGGAEPGARLRSASEGHEFTVSASAEDARKLGAMLYSEVDVELEVCRDFEGRIELGRLMEVHAVSEAEPASAWRQWFKANASEWDEVDDVGAELGRDRH